MVVQDERSGGRDPVVAEQEDINEMLRFGSISYSDWAGYAWKNELNEQRDRVLTHFGEIVRDELTDHNPHHMLERAFSITSFCMRRLIECRLVTDVFRETALSVFKIPRRADPKGRDPFLRSTGGNFFDNFDMKQRVQEPSTPKFIADKFLHARFIAVLSGSCYLADGLLVASDHQSRHSLFHMTLEEFDEIARAFLDDRISMEKDWIDIETGKVHAERL